MRISAWSSDVGSSDLLVTPGPTSTTTPAPSWPRMAGNSPSGSAPDRVNSSVWQTPVALISTSASPALGPSSCTVSMLRGSPPSRATAARTSMEASSRSEEHTSELQSLMRISYAVFCLKKKNNPKTTTLTPQLTTQTIRTQTLY